MENRQTMTTDASGVSEISNAVLSETQVKTILDNVERDHPDRWPAAVKTLLVESFKAIGAIGMVVGNIFSDFTTYRAEQTKLIESHKRLASVVISLRSEVLALKSGLDTKTSGPVPGVEETIAAVVGATGENGSAKTTESTAVGSTPEPIIPQDDAEAMMDAAIVAATGGPDPMEIPVVEIPAEPVVASPSSGARRRGAHRAG